MMFQSILLRKIVKNVTLNLNAKLNHFLPFSRGGIQLLHVWHIMRRDRVGPAWSGIFFMEEIEPDGPLWGAIARSRGGYRAWGECRVDDIF
jgi:hypothetical protein